MSASTRLRRRLATATALILGCALLSGCTTASPTPSPSVSEQKVLAVSTISAKEGGSVAAPNGVKLKVPAGVLKHDSQARITEVAPHQYDIHIDGKWSGKVRVTVPLAGKKNAVLHQVGDMWVMEGGKYNEKSVWVTHLSLFSDLATKAANALCLSFKVSTIAKCLVEKGVKKLNREFAIWLAEKLDNSCVLNTVLDGKDPVGIATNLFIEGPCVGSAGETQDYIDEHIDTDGDGTLDKDEKPAPAPSQAPAPAASADPAPADPAPADPAPAPAAPAPADPAPAPAAPAPADPAPAPADPAPAAPTPAKAWLTRSGDTLTYHYENMPAGMWPEVDRFRCWRYTEQTHPGGWATDGCGEQAGFSGFPAGTGEVTFTYAGATDSFSVEPWKYGPWLNVNEVWQG